MLYNYFWLTSFDLFRSLVLYDFILKKVDNRLDMKNKKKLISLIIAFLWTYFHISYTDGSYWYAYVLYFLFLSALPLNNWIFKVQNVHFENSDKFSLFFYNLIWSQWSMTFPFSPFQLQISCWMAVTFTHWTSKLPSKRQIFFPFTWLTFCDSNGLFFFLFFFAKHSFDKINLLKCIVSVLVTTVPQMGFQRRSYYISQQIKE